MKELKANELIEHFKEAFDEVYELQKEGIEKERKAASVIISITDSESTAQMVCASVHGIRMTIMNLLEQLPLKERIIIAMAINEYTRQELEKLKGNREGETPAFVAPPSKSVN